MMVGSAPRHISFICTVTYASIIRNMHAAHHCNNGDPRILRDLSSEVTGGC